VVRELASETYSYTAQGSNQTGIVDIYIQYEYSQCGAMNENFSIAT
jgi:hypothetical protein